MTWTKDGEIVDYTYVIRRIFITRPLPLLSPPFQQAQDILPQAQQPYPPIAFSPGRRLTKTLEKGRGHCWSQVLQRISEYLAFGRIQCSESDRMEVAFDTQYSKNPNYRTHIQKFTPPILNRTHLRVRIVLHELHIRFHVPEIDHDAIPIRLRSRGVRAWLARPICQR